MELWRSDKKCYRQMLQLRADVTAVVTVVVAVKKRQIEPQEP